MGSARRGYRGAVSPFTRVVALTAVAAGAVAALAVGLAAVQSDPVGVAERRTEPRSGAPPLTLELGVRGDDEALALRRAAALYADGKRLAAGRTFARFRSLEAKVGRALSAWPEDTVDRLNRLAGLHPQRAVVQLNLGLALFWARLAGAEDAWRAAAESEPDTPYAVAAGNLLHPEYAPGLPVFVTTVPIPNGRDSLSPADQLERLRLGAGAGVAGKLLYGVALQRLGRQRSAQRVFAAAARAEPANAEAQVAAAVARFDKARPAESFSRLGPLTRRFPGRATVRFHLGLLLLWSGEVAEARTQLLRATTTEPRSVLARQARRYLDELDAAGVG